MSIKLHQCSPRPVSEGPNHIFICVLLSAFNKILLLLLKIKPVCFACREIEAGGGKKWSDLAVCHSKTNTHPHTHGYTRNCTQWFVLKRKNTTTPKQQRAWCRGKYGIIHFSEDSAYCSMCSSLPVLINPLLGPILTVKLSWTGFYSPPYHLCNHRNMADRTEKKCPTGYSGWAIFNRRVRKWWTHLKKKKKRWHFPRGYPSIHSN